MVKYLESRGGMAPISTNWHNPTVLSNPHADLEALRSALMGLARTPPSAIVRAVSEFI
jgi:hypothetical protein